MKPRPTFYVNVKLWLRSDVHIWALFWIQRTLEYKSGAIWNFSKVSGLPWIDMGHKGLVN